MTQKKNDHDEKLIQELYEKLWWYTHEASDEEFNEKEVDAIVRLLDVLEPVKEDGVFEPEVEASLERFWARVEAEEAAENASAETAAAGTETAGEKTAGAETAGAGTETAGAEGSAVICGGEKRRISKGARRKKVSWKKVGIRFGIGIAACVVLVLSLNIGTYAVRKKSFFEVIREEVGRTEYEITGNVEEGEKEIERGYDSWNELVSALGVSILVPQYLPDAYELKEMSIDYLDVFDFVFVRYEKDDKYILFMIDVYPLNYAKNMVKKSEEWNLVKESIDGYRERYYSLNDEIEASFIYERAIYCIMSNEKMEVIEKIISQMK